MWSYNTSTIWLLCIRTACDWCYKSFQHSYKYFHCYKWICRTTSGFDIPEKCTYSRCTYLTIRALELIPCALNQQSTINRIQCAYKQGEFCNQGFFLAFNRLLLFADHLEATFLQHYLSKSMLNNPLNVLKHAKSRKSSGQSDPKLKTHVHVHRAMNVIYIALIIWQTTQSMHQAHILEW